MPLAITNYNSTSFNLLIFIWGLFSYAHLPLALYSYMCSWFYFIICGFPGDTRTNMTDKINVFWWSLLCYFLKEFFFSYILLTRGLLIIYYNEWAGIISWQLVFHNLFLIYNSLHFMIKRHFFIWGYGHFFIINDITLNFWIMTALFSSYHIRIAVHSHIKIWLFKCLSFYLLSSRQFLIQILGRGLNH